MQSLFAGACACVVTALAATFLSEHYGAPAMLMALLLGMALHFLIEDERARPGIEFCAKRLLRIGVALLGARISFEMVQALGASVVAMLVAAIIATIVFGIVAARLLGRRFRFGVLTGGAVAICGASAAMAIAAVLPARPGPNGKAEAERALLFTVLGVTILSTIAMIGYPLIVSALDLDDVAAGIFIGGTIHDVAQVVGAGFSISPEAGETATLVKLIRVTMLAPFVLIIALAVKRFGPADAEAGERSPLIPMFVIGFFLLAALNSFGLIPELVGDYLEAASRWALVTAIVAVGIKTSLRSILDVGGQAVALIVLETVFIAGFVLLALKWMA
ncbi:MAG: putative sulfate exporter family transporter [Pseudomonadota bacterium]